MSISYLLTWSLSVEVSLQAQVVKVSDKNEQKKVRKRFLSFPRNKSTSEKKSTQRLKPFFTSIEAAVDDDGDDDDDDADAETDSELKKHMSRRPTADKSCFTSRRKSWKTVLFAINVPGLCNKLSLLALLRLSK